MNTYPETPASLDREKLPCGPVVPRFIAWPEVGR